MISSLSEYELPEKKQSVLEQLKGNKEVTESWDSVQIEVITISKQTISSMLTIKSIATFSALFSISIS